MTSNVPFEPILIGAAAAVFGLLVTFGLPVSPRRLNQGLAAILLVALFLTPLWHFMTFRPG